ncbi:hypothetical protein F8568_038865 [Actinomadura sp. LD22]|uniref:MFS transporter n=1 Tax=Actinomadura physcomitrii TaxID=2650748 RepID=A0A6I4MK22_9ACTN|nr:hypothetical protein [Actinomadura physcomitrii]MWA06212.1 hypothetical protein [Actinomadura physcomitrii]
MSSHAHDQPGVPLPAPDRTAPDRTAPDRPAAGGGAAARRLPAALGALLTAVTVLPAAVLVVPDATAGAVPAAARALGLGDARVPALLRATGLSLPALALTVPLAAVAARRLPAWTVLATGLAVLLGGLGAVRFAGSVPLVGAVRAAQGAGAGIALPASLVLVWERRNAVLSVVWAGVLAAALLVAMPVALHAVPPPRPGAAPAGWHAALAPFPWLAGAAAAAAVLGFLLRGRVPWTLPPPRLAERGRLALPSVPIAGFAFLAVVAAHGWSPGARLVVAASALAALAGIAAAGGAEGGPFGCAVVMVATGLLTYPLAAPLSGLAAAGGPASDTLPPAAAAVAAVIGALAASRARPRAAVAAGHALMAAGIALAVAAGPTGRWTPVVLLVPIGTGAGLALAASLRDAHVGAALFGLSLCFPAVLTGQLFVLSLQADRLRRTDAPAGASHLGALADGYRVWLLVAGGAAVLLAALTLRLIARQSGSGERQGGSGERHRRAAESAPVPEAG